MCYAIKRHPRWMHHHRHPRSRSRYSRWSSGWQYPPVNVQELDDHFLLQVFASGYEKEDFTIDVAGETLIIKGSHQSSEGDREHWRRREIEVSDFERRFSLPEEVDTNNIKAKYSDGVLEIVLFKKEGYETLRQAVTIE